MKKNRLFRAKICVFSALLVFCSLFGAVKEVFATGRAIMMSPMSQRIILIPGETYRGGFKVANPVDAETDLNYLATISPFSVTQSDENKNNYDEANYSTKGSRNMIVDWTTIDNPTGTVEPNGEEVVSFTIDVPMDAPAGGQYMAILVKEDPEKQEIEDSMAVTEIMQMAHIIYAEVAGETNETGEVVENYLPSFMLSNDLKAIAVIRNDGNIHVDAKVTLQVWPLFSDEEICTNEEDPDMVIVLPDTQRYHTSECSLPAVGVFRAKQVVNVFGQDYSVERWIVVCPVWLLVVIIFVIFLSVFYLAIRIKNRKKTAKK